MRELRPAPPTANQSIHGGSVQITAVTAPQPIATPQTGPKPKGTSHHHPQHRPHTHSHNTGRNQRLPSQYEYPISPNCEHVVQFYDSDSFLYDSISSFLLTSFFSSQEAAVVLATSNHIVALEHQLFHQHCLFPEVMKRRGQLLMCEAESVLREISANGLTQDSFESFIVPICSKLRDKGYGRILIYGELVNILCEQGRYWDAVQLEKIWNIFLQGPIGTEHGVELLCGYRMDVFAADEQDLQMNGPNVNGTPGGIGNGNYSLSAAFREICRTHSDVRPTEKAGGELDLGDGSRKRLAQGENFSGSPSALDIPRSLVPEQPIAKEQGGMMIAVLQQRIRMLERQVLREQELGRKDREFRKMFNNLPVGIYASYVPAEKPNNSSKTGDQKKAILIPKGKAKKQQPSNKESEQASKGPPIMNAAFTSFLGLDDSVVSGSGLTTVTSAHRKWIDTYVHQDDRKKLIESIESVGFGAALRGAEDKDGENRRKCAYRIIHPTGEVKWYLGETVEGSDDTENTNGDESLRGKEKKYIHSMTDLTDMMSALDMIPPRTKRTLPELEHSASSRQNRDQNRCNPEFSSDNRHIAQAMSGGQKRRAIEGPLEGSQMMGHSNFEYNQGNPYKHHQTHHLQHCAGLDILNLSIPPPEFYADRERDARSQSRPNSRLSQRSQHQHRSAPSYHQYPPIRESHQSPSHETYAAHSNVGAWASEHWYPQAGYDRRGSAVSTRSTNTTRSHGSTSNGLGHERINTGVSSAASTPPTQRRQRLPKPAMDPSRRGSETLPDASD